MKALFFAMLLLTVAAASASAQSCRQTAGTAKAEQLARQCSQVSEATHPPCNAANPCDMMTDEIKHGCAELKEARMTAPAFCAQHLR